MFAAVIVPPTPAPPATINAPVLVLADTVLLLNNKLPTWTFPYTPS